MPNIRRLTIKKWYSAKGFRHTAEDNFGFIIDTKSGLKRTVFMTTITTLSRG